MAGSRCLPWRVLNNDVYNNFTEAAGQRAHPAQLQALLHLVFLPIKEDIQQIGGHQHQSIPFAFCIKAYFRESWIYILIFFGLIGLIGTCGNVYMIIIMKRESSYNRLINFLLLNLCLSDIIKCIFVLPLSLKQQLAQRWWMGKTMCHIMPMVQTCSCLVSVLTYLLIGIDRYLIVYHLKRKENNPLLYTLILSGLWLFCFCLVLPFRSSVEFLDLRLYLGDLFKGQGVCMISQKNLMKEYSSASFIALFAIPMVLVAYFLIRATEELKHRVETNEKNSRETLKESTRSTEDQHLNACQHLKISKRDSAADKNNRSRAVSFISYIAMERAQLRLMLKANKCLSAMVILFLICWSPLQVMLLVGHLIHENERTIMIADVCFLVFMFIGLSSTIINPIILIIQRRAIQQTFDAGKQVLRRLSSARVQRKGHHDIDSSRD